VEEQDTAVRGGRGRGPILSDPAVRERDLSPAPDHVLYRTAHTLGTAAVGVVPGRSVGGGEALVVMTSGIADPDRLELLYVTGPSEFRKRTDCESIYTCKKAQAQQRQLY
jgi:hypothetical protein